MLGVAFLDETVTAGQIGGMSLIALGLAAIDGRLVPPALRTSLNRREADA